MKVIKLFSIFLLALAFSTCSSQPPAATAVTDDLDAAIREASDYLNDSVPAGNMLVILNIQSDYPALSEYIIDELTANTVNDRNFSMVDRHQLDMIREELNFQMSGEVDDQSAQSVGRMLGAQTIVSGAISRFGDMYRLRIRALDVQSARIVGQYNRNVNAGQTITILTESPSVAMGSGTSASVAATPASTARVSSVRDFDMSLINELLGMNRSQVEQRLGTRLEEEGANVYSVNYGQANTLNSLVSFFFNDSGRVEEIFFYYHISEMQTRINNFTRLYGESVIVELNSGIMEHRFDLSNVPLSLNTITVSQSRRYSEVFVISYVLPNIMPSNPVSAQSIPAPTPTPSQSVPAQAPAQAPAPTSPRAYNIGDTGPAGGIIFYDKGNNSGGWRYLEAAPMEAEFQAFWSIRSTFVSDTRTDIGSGFRNTQLIIETFRQTAGEWDTAAQIVNDLVFNGFDDWFLPSRDELDQMYGQLRRRNLGDFRDEWYWTSSEYGVFYEYLALSQNFRTGELYSSNKTTSRNFVRPIRQVPGPS